MEHSKRYLQVRTAVRAAFYTLTVGLFYTVASLDVTWFFQ